MKNSTDKIQKVRNLMRLIKDMPKPVNFTYIDVADLHASMEEYLDYLTSKEVQAQ